MEEYNLENLLEQLNEGLEDLNPDEVKFLNNSFKSELKTLLNKYNCEISLDIIDNKNESNKIILTSEIAHYDGEILLSGNLEFENIKSSLL